MKVKREDLLAAGAALAQVPADQKVREVKVDGKLVDATDARKALSQEKAPVAGEPGRLERVLARFEDKLEPEGAASKGGLRKKLADLARSDPERVATTKVVDITLGDGSSLRIPIEVLDREATAFLQKASATSEVASLIPFVGFLVPAASALAAGIGSLWARATGNKALGAALGGTAKKHLALAATGLVPVLGSATAALAAASDARDAKKVRSAPSVAALSDLSRA